MSKKGRRERYSKIHDDEMWCLATTTARFLAPRLRLMAERHPGHPVSVTDEFWTYLLNQMAEAFELIARDDGLWDFTPEEELKVEHGLSEFRHWYMALWT